VALPPEWRDLGEAIKKATLGSPFLDLSASVEMAELRRDDGVTSC
jgi:hypothetical protein